MFAKIIDKHSIQPFKGCIKDGNTYIYTDEHHTELLNKYAYYEVVDEIPAPSAGDKQVVFDYYEKRDNKIYFVYKEIHVDPVPEKFTEYDKLAAQVLYTSVMTGTLISEDYYV